MNQLLMRDLLGLWEADVTIAEDGAAAVEAVSSGLFDLVLMDIQMPRMDGYEATRKIREVLGLSQDRLPIIALTASAVVEQRQKALDAGMNAFISKPFVPQELRELLGRHLRSLMPEDVEPRELDAPIVLDKAFLLEQTLGKHDLAIKLIDLFVEKLEDTVAEIGGNLNDLDRVRFLAHRLKSSSASIGATQFARTLEELEKAADKSGAEEVHSLARDLEEQMEPLLNGLNRIRLDLS
jgi:CheY-like chemotaxis protein